jgi:predicted nucleic acid-binding protein
VSNFFVDSSAIAKRYLIEIGSTWVISWIEPATRNVIIISELALTEVQSLLARRVREGTLSTTAANALRNDFLIHYRDDY